LVSLKVCDIDSAQMVIRIERGKGRKDRYVMLAPDLLDMLRLWWKAARPQGWLFPGRPAVNPLTTPAAQPPTSAFSGTLATVRPGHATRFFPCPLGHGDWSDRLARRAGSRIS
jgi:integrase